MTTENYQQPVPEISKGRNKANNKIAFGVLILFIGLLLLGKRLGVFQWDFQVWPLILFAVGIYVGIKHQFRDFGAWVLITLGIFFMLPKFFVFGMASTHFILPLMLILWGVYIILNPRRRWKEHSISTIDEDVLNIDVAFGERTSIVTSKTFKGGVISNTFGETKLNLLQADNTEPMILGMKVAFGSVDILVPYNWNVELQIENSFASVEDQRFIHTDTNEQRKLLILRGSCSFGSIKVKSL